MQRVGRNALCPCGSGQKYKRCCGSPEKLEALADSPAAVDPEIQALWKKATQSSSGVPLNSNLSEANPGGTPSVSLPPPIQKQEKMSEATSHLIVAAAWLMAFILSSVLWPPLAVAVGFALVATIYVKFRARDVTGGDLAKAFALTSGYVFLWILALPFIAAFFLFLEHGCQ